MMALASHELHGHLAYIANQILPDTAEADTLERHAAIWGVTRNTGSNATGSVVFTGENDIIIPAETQLRRGDGILYKTTAAATVAVGTVTLQIEALTSGEIANSDIGGTLIMVTPISGLSSSGTVSDDGNGGGITGGLDNEDDTALRARVITRIQQPPHGGAKHDYEAWAKEIAGVTRVWVYPEQLGLGTVWVTFVMECEACPWV